MHHRKNECKLETCDIVMSDWLQCIGMSQSQWQRQFGYAVQWVWRRKSIWLSLTQAKQTITEACLIDSATVPLSMDNIWVLSSGDRPTVAFLIISRGMAILWRLRAEQFKVDKPNKTADRHCHLDSIASRPSDCQTAVDKLIASLETVKSSVRNKANLMAGDKGEREL